MHNIRNKHASSFTSDQSQNNTFGIGIKQTLFTSHRKQHLSKRRNLFERKKMFRCHNLDNKLFMCIKVRLIIYERQHFTFGENLFCREFQATTLTFEGKGCLGC